ncbi:MAG: sigma 54-interacting transcriptional regulator [Syntrophales bacterium]|nr:sigma 54-interacting transcriptional regulator [Syntrophales bacterium]
MFQHGYDKFWEKVIDTMMEGVVVVNPQGIILSVNQALEEITGYHREELLGQPCALIKTDACYHGLSSGAGKQCELFQLGCIRRGKCVLAKKDGSLVHVLKNAALIRDDAGKILGGVETLTDISEVVAKERVISRLRRELSREDGFQGILGKSPAMLQLFSLISSAAQSEAPVIISGESGTGKELVAGAIHRLGPRSQGPFIKVNSAAIHESLLESELFGHVKGAFTGADRSRVGRFEAAHGGDIFLDEVGDMPLSTQAKLLRVLQEKVIEKVGDQKPIPLDVRVITATNKDLYQLMDQGRFREDLFYRINVIPIALPPLRERREDIPLLAEAFIERARLKTRRPITGLSPAALERLLGYDWPGNVRELINAVEYAFVLCQEGNILPEHLPAQFRGQTPVPVRNHSRKPAPDKTPDREELCRAINAAGGKKAEAAQILGVSRVTLWKWLKNHNINVEDIVVTS